MKILGFVADPGGVGHYRILYPFRELREQGGHEAMLAPHESWIEDDDSMWLSYQNPAISIQEIRPDLVVVQKPMRPDWPLLMQEADVPFIVEIDDWHLGMALDNPAASPEKRDTWRVFEQCMRLADCVTVTTPQLAEAYKRFNPNVVVLPNVLDWTMWEPIQPNYERARPDGRIRVGWMGDPGWGRQGDINQLAGWFFEWVAEHPEVDFVHAGPRPPERWLLAETFIHIEGKPFRLNGPPRILDFDIGIVPLAPTRFNECKSNLKGLEYLGAGIPFVAARQPSYIDLVNMCGVGYTARKVPEWTRSLNILLNEAARHIQGEVGRAWVETHTIQRNWRLWESVYENVIANYRQKVAA